VTNRGLYMGQSGHGQEIPRLRSPLGYRSRNAPVGEIVTRVTGFEFGGAED